MAIAQGCTHCGKKGHNRRRCPTLREEENTMARRKTDDTTVSSRGEMNPPISLAEAEASVGADDDGDVEPEQIKEAGVANAESVVFNEHSKEVMKAKKDKSRRVHFNEDNATVIYDLIRQMGWSTSSLRIVCDRVTGEKAQWEIPASALPDGGALYQWVERVCHRKSPERTYAIRFIDAHTSQERGRGKVWMPDTTDVAAPQPTMTTQAQPPPAYAYPYHQPAPPPGFYPGMPPAAAPAPPPPAPPHVSGSSEEVSALRAQLAQLQNDVAMAR